MSDEIALMNPSSQSPEKFSIMRALKKTAKAFGIGRNTKDGEILLGNEELIERLEILNAIVQENGPVTQKIDRNKFFRARINVRRGQLELLIGTNNQISALRFQELVGIETFISVSFDSQGELFGAKLADLQKQNKALFGGAEYNSQGTIYAARQYTRGIDNVGVVTPGGLASIPLTEDAKQNSILLIFEPVNLLIREATEGKAARKVAQQITVIDSESSLPASKNSH